MRNVTPFPGAAEAANDRVITALQIETVMNAMGSIIELMHVTEGDRFKAARAWLLEQADINHAVLDELLSARGA